jgi:hypothetical protein
VSKLAKTALAGTDGRLDKRGEGSRHVNDPPYGHSALDQGR